ncbi:hypothetical protein SAMN02745221_00131 [Thermosyntropha lipolytica DSM 11003]|uniref:Uncharacterized protein n=1 Tax=Thermosyntropha lipolytica DSM 11003 TaxID=1123382 RepID=A0A1M5JJF9_9FIRM|nr:hypothetical protein [Thermosyntropha lipolytica]SHG40173.1 hypothetical protein SAMN02745221_00131 [Thermosyntropha lipolytica DSM 11003]
MENQENLLLDVDEFEIPSKDVEEILNSKRNHVLYLFLLEGIANIAPMLMISRISDENVVKNLSLKTQIDDIKSYVKENISVFGLKGRSHYFRNEVCLGEIIHYLYIIRGITGDPFEPFICVSLKDNVYTCIAYANTKEFIVISSNGTDLISSVLQKASQKGMYSLYRYVDLINSCIECKFP